MAIRQILIAIPMGSKMDVHRYIGMSRLPECEYYENSLDFCNSRDRDKFVGHIFS